MNLWRCTHIQLFTVSASLCFSLPLWCGIKFTYEGEIIINTLCYTSAILNVCRQRVPLRYQLYFMGYCFTELTRMRFANSAPLHILPSFIFLNFKKPGIYQLLIGRHQLLVGFSRRNYLYYFTSCLKSSHFIQV